jgi:hypothetical protein
MNSSDHFSESIFFLEEPLIKTNVGGGVIPLPKLGLVRFYLLLHFRIV